MLELSSLILISVMEQGDLGLDSFPEQNHTPGFVQSKQRTSPRRQIYLRNSHEPNAVFLKNKIARDPLTCVAS